MALHMVKLVVGCDTVEDLVAWHSERPWIMHTRQTPKRAAELLEGAGVDCTELKSNSRKLILTDEKNKIRFFLAKPADVPTYVELGAADLGVAGKDVLMEYGSQSLYEPLDLKIAKCKLMTAGAVGASGVPKLAKITVIFAFSAGMS